MTPKKLAKALLFPHISVALILIPASVAFLVYSMLNYDSASLIACVSYALSAYTLTVWCVRIPSLIVFFKTLKEENKYVRRWYGDEPWRLKVSLYSSLLFNISYACFNLFLGYYHSTFWFYSLAVYYLSLALMRFFLLRYTRKNTPGEKMRSELTRYRACGWILLFMNLAVSLMIFFMVYWNRTFIHHEITTIAIAAYTFTTLITAIIGLIKQRKVNSPILSAAKSISLASACVSMLTLESTMLTTFGKETLSLGERRLFLGLSGAAVSAFIITVAVFMVVTSSKKIKIFKTEENTNA